MPVVNLGPFRRLLAGPARAAKRRLVDAPADRLRDAIVHEADRVRDAVVHESNRLFERVAAHVYQQVSAHAALARAGTAAAPPPPADPGPAVTAATVRLISRASPGSFFECRLNGVEARLPVETLRTMSHCVHGRADAPFDVAVETVHLDWLRAELRPGDVFLDVGAATGAMAVPIALGRPGVRVVAFEPSRTARRILTDTLAANRIGAVEVRPEAVADAPGTVQFTEMRYDDSGKYPYLPETSSLTTDRMDPDRVAAEYDVPVTTLDLFFAGRADGPAVRAVKVDVEGFEVRVLRGAARFLAATAPYLAIDIHADPFGDGDTEAGCRAVLGGLGYTFATAGHVLLCSPPGAGN